MNQEEKGTMQFSILISDRPSPNQLLIQEMYNLWTNWQKTQR